MLKLKYLQTTLWMIRTLIFLIGILLVPKPYNIVFIPLILLGLVMVWITLLLAIKSKE